LHRGEHHAASAPLLAFSQTLSTSAGAHRTSLTLCTFGTVV
jgi:hypothetical protein